MGSPSASTVINADNLFIEQRAGSSTYSGTTPIPDGGTAAISGVEPFRSDVSARTSTAPGRFLNPATAQPSIDGAETASFLDPERVASLRHQNAGGDGLLVLSYRFPAAGPASGGLAQGVAPQPGGTYALSPASTNRQDGVYLAVPQTQVPGFGAPVTTIEAPGPTVPFAAAQWALVASPNVANAVSVVNRADGTCLDVFGASSNAGAVIDAFPCNGQDNQLWEIALAADGTATLASVPWGFLLTAGSGGFTQEIAGNAPDGSQSFWFDAIVEEQGTLPTYSVPFGLDESLPFALDTGDLDRSVDSIGRYRDESVIAWADDENRFLNVAVVDHNANASHLLVSPLTLDIAVGAPGFPGSIGVAVGDFDGASNSQNEIAVTWQDGGGTIHASLLTYAASDTRSSDGFGGTRSLAVAVADTGPRLGAVGFPDAASLVGGIGNAAAGDLLNTGHQQLVVTWADDAGSNNATEVGNAHVGAIAFGSDLSVAQVAALQLTGDGLSATVYGNFVRQGLPVVVGLFKYAPSSDVAASYPLTRRQVVVAWGSDNRANFRTIDAVNNATNGTFSLTPLSQPVYLDTVTPGELAPGRPISLTAGAFADKGATDEVPLWGIAATSTPMNAAPVATQWSVENGTWQVVNGATIPIAGSTGSEANVTLTAFDQLDQTLRVGAPITMTIDSQPSVQAAAAQPPTHSDYLPDAQARDSNGFVNINRGYGFSLTLGQSSTDNTSVSYTASKTGTVGTSNTLDVNASIKTGIPGVASVSASLDSNTKFALQNTATTATSTDYSVTQGNTNTATTSDDDELFYHSQTSVIYRYPILGGPQTSDGQVVSEANCSPCYGFYDVLVPLYVSPQALMAGRSVDPSVGWNPSWQNNNILSYPLEPDTSDLGSTLASDGPATPATTQYSVGANASTQQLDISTLNGTTGSSSSSTTWNLDETVTASASVKVGVPGNYTKDGATLSLGVNGGQTLSNSSQGTTTNQVGSSLSINVPAFSEEYQYVTNSTSYYSTSGTFKTVHGANLPSVASEPGAAFWLNNYSAADLALNMPLATVLNTPNNVTESPTVNFEPNVDRQVIRGFKILQPEGPDTLTSEVPFAFGDNPVSGETVQFSVPISNYSVATTSIETPVNFYLQPTDGKFNDSSATPQLILEATVPALAPGQEFTVVSPPWQVPAVDAAQNYRIFVEVNPEANQPETHPLNPVTDPNTGQKTFTACDPTWKLQDPFNGNNTEQLACGQNNRGWGQLTVTPADLGATGLEATREADVRPIGATFVASPESTAVDAAQGPTQVTQGAVTYGQIQFTGDADTVVNQLVEVYDGPPSDGKLIAVTTLRAAAAGAPREAEYRWQPTELGRHQLHQVIRSSLGGGDTWTQTVDVDVVAASNGGGNGGTPDPDGGSTGSGDGSGSGEHANDASGKQADDATASRGNGLANTGGAVAWLPALGALALIVSGGLLVRRRRARL